MPFPYIFFTFVTLSLFRAGFIVAAGVTVLCLVAWLVYDLRRTPKQFILAILMGLALGAWLFSLRSGALSDASDMPTAATGRIAAVSRRSVIVETEGGRRLRLIGFGKMPLPPKHAQVTYRCDLADVPPSTFATFERLSGTRSWCRVKALQVLPAPPGKVIELRQRALSFLQSRFEALGERSLAAAFLIGDTGDLGENELAAFRDMGLMHLFAVSGLNIALLFALLYLPFRALRLPAVGTLLGFAVASAFLVLLDFPVPLLRAWLFMAIAVLMRLIDRRITSFTLLFLTAIIVEVLFPLSTFSMSFILSFGVTAAILVFYEPLYFCFASANRWLNFASQHVALSLAAGLPAMLLSHLLFGSANPLSLIYNLLLVPFSGLYLFSALLYLVLPPAAHVLHSLDWLYLKFAALHGDHAMRLLPAAEPLARAASFIFIAALLVTLIYLKFRGRLWSARRNLRFVMPVSALALAAPWFLVTYPTFAFYAIPNKVWIYHERNIVTLGKPVFADTEKTKPQFCFPWSGVTNEQESIRDLYKLHGQCFVFTGRMRPELWGATALLDCRMLHVYQSSKTKTTANDWKALFSVFGYKGEVTVRRFYTWYGDRLGNCIKEKL